MIVFWKSRFLFLKYWNDCVQALIVIFMLSLKQRQSYHAMIG